MVVLRFAGSLRKSSEVIKKQRTSWAFGQLVSASPQVGTLPDRDSYPLVAGSSPARPHVRGCFS